MVIARDDQHLKPEECLANAIILQAVDDWREAMKRLWKNPNNKSAQSDRNECERFFLSEWFMVLTKVEGETVLSRLKAEFEAKYKEDF